MTEQPEGQDGIFPAATAKATATAPPATLIGRQDGIFPATIAEATATAPPATFIVDAYQILNQLSSQELEQLANKLKELRSQIPPATLSGTAMVDQVTGTGTLSGTAAGTSTVAGTLTESLPQPLTDLITQRSKNIAATVYYLLAIINQILRLRANPGELKNLIDAIIEQAKQLAENSW